MLKFETAALHFQNNSARYVLHCFSNGNKGKLREVKLLSQGHRAYQGQGWDSNSSLGLVKKPVP